MNFFLGVFLIITLTRALKVIGDLERRVQDLQTQLMVAKWLREEQ